MRFWGFLPGQVPELPTAALSVPFLLNTQPNGWSAQNIGSIQKWILEFSFIDYDVFLSCFWYVFLEEMCFSRLP